MKKFELGMKALEKLKVMPEIIREYKKDHIMRSEYGGTLWDLSEEQKSKVKELEASGYKVIHLIDCSYKDSYGDIIHMIDYLLVKDYDDEEMEYVLEDLDYNCIFAYAYNASDPMLSEYGTISVKPINGGLARAS